MLFTGRALQAAPGSLPPQRGAGESEPGVPPLLAADPETTMGSGSILFAWRVRPGAEAPTPPLSPAAGGAPPGFKGDAVARTTPRDPIYVTR